MLTALFFLLAFATIGTLVWAGLQLLQVEENPLADRLQELQSNAMVTSVGRTPRRTGKGGFLNWVLYFVSVIPGGEDWIEGKRAESGRHSQPQGRGDLRALQSRLPGRADRRRDLSAVGQAVHAGPDR